MRTKSDAELLNDYATNQSEAAFGEMVRRYADVVYSAALRQVGNEAQARDAAQIVFVNLARKVASLNANIVLIGWLHRAARLAALELLRKDQRRLQRERQAMEFHDPSPESDDWNVVRPVLDEAIANLGDEDRHALLLRFFKNESLASVGTTLGVSEDAAQKRVSRALGKLREFLADRGIHTTAAALSVTLTANAVQIAPTGLVASLTAGALTNAAVAGSSTVPLLKLCTYSNMKTAILVLTLAGGLAGITFVRVQSQHRLQEAQALTQQQAEEIEALRTLNEQLARQTNNVTSLSDEALELLRLRGEVTRLRRDLADQKAFASTTPKVKPKIEPDAAVQQISIRAKFISVPASHTAGIATGELTDSQFRLLLQSLEKIDGVRFISEGGIVTLNGRQAHLQISADNTRTNGPLFILDVLPAWAANSRNINLEFSFGSEAMVDLQPEDLPPNTPTRVRDVRSLQITNSMSLRDGQTLLLSRQISSNEKWLQGDSTASGAEPGYLLILLTTTLIDPSGNRLFTDENPAEQSANTPASVPTQPNVFPGVLPQAESP